MGMESVAIGDPMFDSVQQFHFMLEESVRLGIAYAFLEPDGEIRYIAAENVTEDMAADALPLDELKLINEQHRLRDAAPLN